MHDLSAIFSIPRASTLPSASPRRFSPQLLLLAVSIAASACSGSERDLGPEPPSRDGGMMAQGAPTGDASAPPDDVVEPSGEPPSDPGVQPPPPDEDFIYPSQIFTGFDGTNTFRAPMATSLGGGTWEVADPTVARVDALATPPGYEGFLFGMLVSLKPGTTQVRARMGMKLVSAEVTVTSYTVAQVAAGKTRYEMPANANTPTRQACAFCHLSDNGVDHSPTALAYFADSEILSAITTGVYPDGYVLTGVPHKWDLTPEEREGIVPYLRSLPPGPID